MQLKSQFQTTRKWALSISAYFTRLKEMAYNLALASSLINKDDFIMYLLYGVILVEITMDGTAEDAGKAADQHRG